GRATAARRRPGARRGGRLPAVRDRRRAGDQRGLLRPRVRAEGRPVSPLPPDRLPAGLLTPGGSPCIGFRRAPAPHLLPRGTPSLAEAPPTAHATTIVALTHAGGIVMAGDRRATMGTAIAHRQIEKVFPADAYSAIGIAGTAGLAVDLVRLFQ